MLHSLLSFVSRPAHGLLHASALGVLSFALIAAGGPIQYNGPMFLTSPGNGTTTLQTSYGANGSPLSVSPTGGFYSNIFKVYANPGTGSGGGYVTGATLESHIQGGSGGSGTSSAVGISANGYLDSGAATGMQAVGVSASGTSAAGGSMFGANFGAYSNTTASTQLIGIETDMSNAAGTQLKFGHVVESLGGDTGAVTGSVNVLGSGNSVATNAAYVVQGNPGGSGFAYGMLSILSNGGGVAPITSAMWRAGGYTVPQGLDWRDLTISGNAIYLPNYTLSGAGVSTYTGTASIPIKATGAGTSNQAFQIQNTGGSTLMGTDQSAGGGNFLGSPAYASDFGSSTNTSVCIATNNNCRLLINGSGNGSFTNPLQSASAAAGTQSYLAPVYTSGGAAVASTEHGVAYSCTFAASTTCAVSLTGANTGQFTSASSYSCSPPDMGTSTTYVGFTVGNKTASSFTVYASASNSDTVNGTCWGT